MATHADSEWMDPCLFDKCEESRRLPATRPPIPTIPVTISTQPDGDHRNGEEPRPRSPSPQFSDDELPPTNPFKNSHLRSRVKVPLRPPPAIPSRSLKPSLLVKGSRVIIAIDYGTTYTGLAIAHVTSENANIDDIEVLQNWGPNGSNLSKARSMISYARTNDGKTQWGSAVSDHNTAMVNTKLDLEPQPGRYDELEMTWYLLMGTGNLAFEHLKKIGPDPAYTSAPPEQIVQDYLTHIFESACRQGVFKTDLSKLEETRTPIDIVVTVPAVI